MDFDLSKTVKKMGKKSKQLISSGPSHEYMEFLNEKKKEKKEAKEKT